MNVYKRFREFGGIHLLYTYWRMGALGTFVANGFNVIRGKYNILTAYSRSMKKVVPILHKQYYPLLKSLKAHYDSIPLEHVHQHTIWSCWLQGIAHAPELVKACDHARKAIFKEWNVVMLDENNIKDYIDIPYDIRRKYERGVIPHAMYSDLVRLELLIKYGGTWMDATVLCTGLEYPPEVMEGDFFIFQYYNRRVQKRQGLSNWFITACSNNKMLLILRDMLYQYWRDYDCGVYYYIFHTYLSWILHEYPLEEANIPFGSSNVAITMGRRLKERKYDNVWMQNLLKNCCFHKLTYRLPDRVTRAPDSFYAHVISMAYQL